jgi:predicted ester cyclase
VALKKVDHLSQVQKKRGKEKIMTVQENVALARSLTDLYNSHQSNPTWLEKSLSAFATDSQHTNVPLGITLPGREGYKQSGLFFAEAFPDSTIEVTNVFATEDQVVFEYTGHGTNTGQLHLPTGDIPATGRWAELRLCDVPPIRNGKIVSYHSYYDPMTMLQQLGLYLRKDSRVSERSHDLPWIGEELGRKLLPSSF